MKKNKHILEVAKLFDFKKLLIRKIEREKNTLYIKAGNSSVDVVIYDKTNHIDEIGGQAYEELFEQKYGSPQDLIRIDFRVKNKKINEKISVALKNKDFSKIEALVLEEIEKRVKVSRKIKRFLKT